MVADVVGASGVGDTEQVRWWCEVTHTDGLASERLCEGVPESGVDGVAAVVDGVAALVESDGVGVREPKGHSVGQSVGASRVLGVGQDTEGVGVVGVTLGVGVTVSVTVGDGFKLPVGLGPGMGMTVGPVFGSGPEVVGAGAEVVARFVGELG